MNTLKIYFLPFLAIALMTFTSCGDDDIDIEEGGELITSLVYVLTSPTGSTATFTFEDSDGDGGMPPVMTSQNLTANTPYSGTLSLSNTSTSPPIDITEEIQEEKEEHQFFISSTVPELTISYNDSDDNAQPIGLSTTLTTGAAGDGVLTIILRHEPDKAASGVAEGDITNAGGETDIEVMFSVTVE